MFHLLSLSVPRGVIQNGARVRSQALFPVIRPLPVSPVGSRTSAIRWVNFAPAAFKRIINTSGGLHTRIPSPTDTPTPTCSGTKLGELPNFPLIVYIITSLLCSKVRGVHTLPAVHDVSSRCVYIMVSRRHTNTNRFIRGRGLVIQRTLGACTDMHPSQEHESMMACTA